MTEPKSTRAETPDDLPEEEAPAYDEPPAAPADPLFEDEEAPDLPPDPEPDEPQEALPEPEPETEPESAAATAPEPEPVVDMEPEPQPEALAEPDDEPDTPEQAAAAAADEALDDPHHDIFGPEPWEQAPTAPPPPPAPAEPPPAHEPSLAEVFQAAGPGEAAAPRKLAAQGVPLTGSPGAEATLEVKRSAFAVYLLYLSALVVVGIPLPIGAWLAYDARKDAPGWLRSHYTYQIRTFWICMGGLALAALVLFLPFGMFPLTIVAVVIWLVVRCFFGLVRLHRGEPIFNPQTWIV